MLTLTFGRYATIVAAFIRLAMIRIMLNRLVANPLSCFVDDRIIEPAS